MTEQLTIPSTWQKVSLSNCLELNQSGTWGDEPRGDDTDTPVLRSTNIQDGYMILKDVAYRRIKPRDLSRFALVDGDILVTKSSGSPQLLGKNFLFSSPNDGRVYLFSNFTQRLRTNLELLFPEYLYFFLNSQYTHHFLQRIQSTTSGLRNLDMNLYASQLIPLPPISEQRRIAAILRQANELRRLRRQADDKAKRLYASLYFEMFGTGEPNEKHPSVVKLHTLLKVPISTGFSPNTSDEPLGLPVLTLSAITGSGLDETQVKYFTDTSYRGKGSDLEEDDILITRSNTIELVGKVDRYRGNPRIVIYPDLAMRLRPKNKIDSVYLENALRNECTLSAIRRLARGTSASMKKISQSDVNNFDILWPSESERHLFSERVQGVDGLREDQKRFSNHLEELFAALTARAFTGELTAHWREAHDEQLREEAVQRDIALGLRGTEPTLGDLEAGRVTRAEKEEANRLVTQALEQLRSIPSNAFQGLITETFGDIAKLDINTLLGSNAQGIRAMQADVQELLAAQMAPVSALLADQLSGLTQQIQSLHLESLSKAAFQPSPELSRQIAGWLSNIGRLGAVAEVLSSRKALRDTLSEDLSTLISKVAAAPPYFRPADLEGDEASLLQVEERLRLLVALGIVRPVTVHGQACYRLVSRDREHTVPEGLEL